MMSASKPRSSFNGSNYIGYESYWIFKLKYNKCSLLNKCDAITLNRCSGIANFPLPHAAICLPSKMCYFGAVTHILWTTCLISVESTPPLLFLFPKFIHLFHAGCEVYTPSTLQRGSGQRGAHLHGHDSGSPVKLRRLTKGVSISLPSSPLLPRQADIVSSQSCLKFPGGLRWNNINKAWPQWQWAMHEGIDLNVTVLTWLCFD